MLELCRRPLETCFGVGDWGGAAAGVSGADELAWQTNLLSHAFGEYSMAVVQANSLLEDQAQVLASPSATFIGIFDGHGGPEAARFINSNFFSFLQKYTSELGGLCADALRKAFDTTEHEFLQLVRKSWITNPQMALSGSCCLVAVISNNNLHIANIGDSRAVLGRKVYGSGMFSPSAVVAERLTSDHNVGDEDVRKEVRALHPDDSHIVVYTRGFWRIKGIIQESKPATANSAASGFHKKIMREWRVLASNLSETIFRSGLRDPDLAPPSRYHRSSRNAVPRRPLLLRHFLALRLSVSPSPGPLPVFRVLDQPESLREWPSLLNTWFENKTEKWDRNQSTILQVLLSIQDLVLNEKPFFNEPGTGAMSSPKAAGEFRGTGGLSLPGEGRCNFNCLRRVLLGASKRRRKNHRGLRRRWLEDGGLGLRCSR